MKPEIRATAVKAKGYEGHFRAVVAVEIGFSSRRIQAHPRAFPSRSEAVEAAKKAIADRGQEFIDAAIARMD